MGVGDLTPGEVSNIQSLTEHVGRPIYVVGSAASGSRKPGSDIDYVATPTNAPDWQAVQHMLPSIDPEHGVVSGNPNPHQGPVIRFTPGEMPDYLKKQ